MKPKNGPEVEGPNSPNLDGGDPFSCSDMKKGGKRPNLDNQKENAQSRRRAERGGGYLQNTDKTKYRQVSVKLQIVATARIAHSFLIITSRINRDRFLENRLRSMRRKASRSSFYKRARWLPRSIPQKKHHARFSRPRPSPFDCIRRAGKIKLFRTRTLRAD